MPIKRAGKSAATTPTIKRVQQQSVDGPTKDDLKGHLLVITLRDYDAEFTTSFGPGPRAVLDIVDLDDSNATHTAFWLFGNAAKQIAAHLGLDEIGLGRLRTFETRTGNSGWGFDFTEDEAEYQRAEAVLSTDAPF
jgi:hypothetical protein